MKQYHPLSEQLVKILQTRTQNTNPLFFRVLTAFYLTMLASHMRIGIKGWIGKGTIPINMFAINLALSGSGKGHSMSTLEQEVINNFQTVFTERTFPITAESNCEVLASKRATKNGTDLDDEMAKVTKEFYSLGALLFSFDSATTPAIKQMRQKLLMANAGSCNLIIDEAGANFSSSIEALNTYLELYDKGLLKEKLTKSSSDNVRFERINGYTPANLLMFGTPSKLLDGGRTEELFYEMLEMGYARRCFFGFSDKTSKANNQSVDDVMKQLFDNNDDDVIEDISDQLSLLADLANMNKTLKLTQNSIKHLLTYKINCENKSRQLSDIDVVKKSELEHRYFKVLKLAGTYAFIDGSDTIEPIHIDYAISLAEDSGEAFTALLTPQRPYTKLANYLALIKEEVTLADLDTDLPYFKGSKAQKDELITMATAWGYKNNIIIKKSYVDNIMFLHADSIQETNTDKLIVSYTNHSDMTTGYNNDLVSFDNLPKLFKANGYHWLNHHVKDGYRKEDNCIVGFNTLVFDVDGTCSLNTAMLLLKKYKAIYYTTKSHTDQVNRFRIVIPTNYTLKLDAKDYKELYNNIINDLPFEVDTQCSHRAKKWLANSNTQIHVTDGELFDVLPYIPKSSKNDERVKSIESQQDLDRLERWVMNNIGDGNRNNMLLRYALLLIDSGFDFANIKDKVGSLNNKLADKLDELELTNTIYHTVAGKLASLGRLQ